MNELPDDPRLDSLYVSFARKISADYPEVAITWIDAILDADRRRAVKDTILRSWFVKDRMEAEMWMKSQLEQLEPEIGVFGSLENTYSQKE